MIRTQCIISPMGNYYLKECALKRTRLHSTNDTKGGITPIRRSNKEEKIRVVGVRVGLGNNYPEFPTDTTPKT